MNFIHFSGYSMQINNNISIGNQGITKTTKQCYSVLTMIFLLLAFLQPYVAVQALERQQEASINKVVQAFKQNNRAAISEMISYPLFRQAP